MRGTSVDVPGIRSGPPSSVYSDTEFANDATTFRVKSPSLLVCVIRPTAINVVTGLATAAHESESGSTGFKCGVPCGPYMTCLGILVTCLNLLCANGFNKAGLKRKVLSIVFPLRRTAVVIQCDACSNAGIGVGRSGARRSRTPALWCRGHRLGQPPTEAYRLTTTVISSRRRAGAWFGEGGRAQEKLWFIALEFSPRHT